jgi:ankyrin repeat protein
VEHGVSAELDPAGQWYSLYDVLRQRDLDALRADPIAWTIWLGVVIDGQVRNGGWLQAYWNLGRSGIALPEMGEVLHRLGAIDACNDSARLAIRLLDKPRQKAWLDESGPFGAPPALQKMTNPMNMRFYRAIPSVRVRLQEYIWTHREALADALAAAEPYEAFNDRTPLHRAADDGNLAWLKRELARGVPVDSEDADGETPLMLALAHGESEAALAIIDALLAAGADVTRRTRFGRLLTSVKPECRALIRRLVEAGLPVTAVDKNGSGLLHDVHDATTTRFLVKAGADPNLANAHGVTPLNLAVMRMANANGAAARKKAAGVMRALVKAGAVNSVTSRGSDVFWRAGADSSTIARLIEAGLSIVTEADADGRHGETALHRVARTGSTMAIEQLLHAGAPVNALTREEDEELGLPAGATALDLAVAAKHTRARNLLRKAGGVSGLVTP